MAIDTKKAKPAKSLEIIVERDGKLVTRWIARIGGLPGHDPVWVAKNGEAIEFETEQDADNCAKEVAAKWKASAQTGGGG